MIRCKAHCVDINRLGVTCYECDRRRDGQTDILVAYVPQTLRDPNAITDFPSRINKGTVLLAQRLGVLGKS